MKSDSDSLMPVDFLAEPTQVKLESDTAAASASTASKGKRKRSKNAPQPDPRPSSSSSESSESEDDKRHRRPNKKIKQDVIVSSRAHKRRVVMAPKVVREPRCKCNCSEELGQLADSLEKLKSFLRANYCDHCKKAGHTRTTCRKRRQPPTFEFDLD